MDFDVTLKSKEHYSKIFCDVSATGILGSVLFQMVSIVNSVKDIQGNYRKMVFCSRGAARAANPTSEGFVDQSSLSYAWW